MIAIKNILVATDFSGPADAALRYGRAFAGSFAATLHVLHVVGDVSWLASGADGYATSLPDMQRDVENAAGCPVLTVRHPEREFVTADAVVAGARARTSESQSA